MQTRSRGHLQRALIAAGTARILGLMAVACLTAGLPRASAAAQTAVASSHRATESQSSRPSRVTPDERVQILVHVLMTDSSAVRRRTAAWGLAPYSGLATASDALVGSLQHDASADVRETSAWSLAAARSSSTAVTAALAKALRSDPSERVRATAAWAIGSVDGQGAADALISALRDADPDVRIRAVWALGTVQRGRAPTELVACLSDANARIRELAAWALRSIGDRSTIGALASAFRSETDEHIRVDDMHALNSMDDASLDAIRSILESSDKKLQAAGIDALGGGRASGPWPWPWPDPRPFP